VVRKNRDLNIGGPLLAERGDQAVDGTVVSESWRRAGQTDIRGLVTAGRAVRLEMSAALKGGRGNENRCCS
jgi:hypothetical protein